MKIAPLIGLIGLAASSPLLIGCRNAELVSNRSEYIRAEHRLDITTESQPLGDSGDYIIHQGFFLDYFALPDTPDEQDPWDAILITKDVVTGSFQKKAEAIRNNQVPYELYLNDRFVEQLDRHEDVAAAFLHWMPSDVVEEYLDPVSRLPKKRLRGYSILTEEQELANSYLPSVFDHPIFYRDDSSITPAKRNLLDYMPSFSWKK